MIRRYAPFAVFLLLVVLTASVGGLFTPGEWYAMLEKPSWNPPSWVFGPVWSVLYLMMAVAMWKVWDSQHQNRRAALGLWLSQLVLNAAWSWLFFGLERPGWAWAEMTILIILVLLCIRTFRLISPLAAYLLIPYLAWLLFAWFLNLTIWTLNGGMFASFVS